VREKGSDTWQSMAEGLGRHMERLNVAMEIRSTETIKQGVLAGMGIAFLSAHTVSRELREGSLVMLDVQGFPLMLNWYVVQRRGKRLPPVAQAFREFLLTEGARLIREVDPLPARVRRRPAR
jgi:DNA-binding transcriptional LysR family regulator